MRTISTRLPECPDTYCGPGKFKVIVAKDPPRLSLTNKLTKSSDANAADTGIQA